MGDRDMFGADVATVWAASGRLASESVARLERSSSSESASFSLLNKTMELLRTSRQCVVRTDALIARMWGDFDDNAAPSAPCNDHR